MASGSPKPSSSTPSFRARRISATALMPCHKCVSGGRRRLRDKNAPPG
jgi:hypothetical protein